MPWNTGNAAVYSWECIGLDASERELAEKIMEETKYVRETEHVSACRRKERKDEEFDLYAHESHRWSPVTHYLEPYL